MQGQRRHLHWSFLRDRRVESNWLSRHGPGSKAEMVWFSWTGIAWSCWLKGCSWWELKVMWRRWVSVVACTKLQTAWKLEVWNTSGGTRQAPTPKTGLSFRKLWASYTCCLHLLWFSNKFCFIRYIPVLDTACCSLTSSEARREHPRKALAASLTGSFQAEICSWPTQSPSRDEAHGYGNWGSDTTPWSMHCLHGEDGYSDSPDRAWQKMKLPWTGESGALLTQVHLTIIEQHTKRLKSRTQPLRSRRDAFPLTSWFANVT